jgi:hypothetical protein
MLSVRCPGHRVDEFFTIAMVGGEHDRVVTGDRSVHDPTCFAVQGLNGFNHGIRFGSMAHHVTVGKIDQDKAVNILFDGTNHRIGDFFGAHRGFEIIGGHLG